MLIATIPGGVAGHPSDTGYFFGCVLLAAMGVTAGLYDIPLAGISAGPQPAGIARLDHGGLQLSHVCRHVGGLGRVLAALRPAGALAPNDLPRRRDHHRAGNDLDRSALALSNHAAGRASADRLHVSRAGRRAGKRADTAACWCVANHISWADGVLLGLACPRHPRMVAYAKYFENPLAGLVRPAGANHPHWDDAASRWPSRSAPPARPCNRARSCVSFPKAASAAPAKLQEFRPGFLSILKDTDVPVVPVYLGGLVGKHLQLRGRQVFLEMAQTLALSRLHPLRTAHPRPHNRRPGQGRCRRIEGGPIVIRAENDCNFPFEVSLFSIRYVRLESGRL